MAGDDLKLKVTYEVEQFASLKMMVGRLHFLFKMVPFQVSCEKLGVFSAHVHHKVPSENIQLDV